MSLKNHTNTKWGNSVLGKHNTKDTDQGDGLTLNMNMYKIQLLSNSNNPFINNNC